MTLASDHVATLCLCFPSYKVGRMPFYLTSAVRTKYSTVPPGIPCILGSCITILSSLSPSILAPLSSAPDLCALVYFSAQGTNHKTIPSSFPDIWCL